MGGKITKFVMEDVRCFAGQQEFEIRPLTFLVGENSTGKSTALGCFQVLTNYLSRASRSIGELDFNVEPYSMGSFADIVTRKRPVGKKFYLGFKMDEATERRDATEYIIQLVEREQSAEPMVNCIKIKFNDGEICFNHKKRQKTQKEFEVKSVDETKQSFNIDCDLLDLWSGPEYILLELQNSLTEFGNLRMLKVENGKGTTIRQKSNAKKRSQKEKQLIKFLSKREIRMVFRNRLTSFSFAPLRSRPKRTYDPIREFEDPEGGDIPMRIRRMENTEDGQWEHLKRQLFQFGKDSGLFETIEVRKHGKSKSDPFQIQVKVRGPKSNIMDVGYGINQILPILIKILSDRYSNFFLMQQPEVHLHPKGQAELASLFTRFTRLAGKRRSFIIETHSDYMLDRARIEIRKGTIKSGDVSLIYMEPKGSHVKVHNIGFDKLGNLTGVPRSYGDFFSKETDKLLGYKD